MKISLLTTIFITRKCIKQLSCHANSGYVIGVNNQDYSLFIKNR